MTWQTPYMGRPGAMRALPDLADKFSAPEDLGESTTRLASGGTAVTHRPFGKKTYTLPYTWADPSEARTLIGFYMRAYGNGPWVYVDPHATNVLGFDVASCGVRSNAPHGWVASSGTITRTSTPPTDAPDSGVLHIATPSANLALIPGSTTDTADTASAPAYVADLPVAPSLYVRASAACTGQVQAAGFDTTGALTSSSLAAAASITTSWQRFIVIGATNEPALAGSAMVLPRLFIASPPSWVEIAAAQLEYADAETDWTWGSGARRVNITSSPGDDVQLLGYSDHTLTLGEV